MTSAALAARLRPYWGAASEVAPGVLAAPPHGERGWWSYCTSSLSAHALDLPPDLAGQVPARLELVTYALDDEPWAPALLTELAAAPGALLPYQPLRLTAPLDHGSTLVGVLLLPPYFEPEHLAQLDAETGLLWAVPITAAELELAVLAGGRAVEQALIEADLRPYPDVWRASVV
jgi:hypothetical protein